ncbi:D-aminoacyl-tRNA deacylase [Inconstantimicrobium mannanitabidum]|uniref:D-aminoacyl-tRNA deacylase n=1 Tax=Inconstantimicrobium mannanitabidum TaxID=1604901 RepID=A0ACB5RA80_9CLOT|nr:D-aminoacyl-tRNA deacylase [Clostridium sp. TW13]GKX66042.1 D-aminoacyl-tRNA deacylase [Clostridium sp. TW13]
MRAVVQRVKKSDVKVDGKVVGEIQKGFNVLVGISKDDTIEDLKYIRDKIINLRVFEDENEKMNLSLKEVGGELLVISQFTLYGDCRKGRRPNFMDALAGEEAKGFYLKFLEMLKEENIKVEAGIFGANMEVNIVNDGPVTLILDSKRSF